jgi:copper chaperone
LIYKHIKKEKIMTTFHIPGMHCGGCKSTVEKTILALDPAAQIEFDMPARKVSLESSADTARVQAVLAEAGYPAAPA